MHFTRFLLVSFAFHALAVIAALFLVKPRLPVLPLFTPVEIVNLPPQEIRQLPPVQKPVPVRPRPVIPRNFVPERPLPPSAASAPKKISGNSDRTEIPKGVPEIGLPKGAEQGSNAGKTGVETTQPSVIPDQKLPFLTQKDIDQLARKGMPAKKPGADSVTLDTDEFKFISYNRWLEVKINRVIQYPELAKISGLQGILHVQFTILKDGSVASVDVLKSSGYKILDDEIVNAIRASGPFDPLPDDWSMDHYTITGYGIFLLGHGYIQ